MPIFQDTDGSVICYMDMTDWDYEIGSASKGTRVFPTIHSLLASSPCADGCGIVKVRVELIEVVQKPKEE